MSCYEVTLAQSIQEVYRKQFQAKSKQEAETLAHLDVIGGVDHTWKYDGSSGRVDGEVLKVEEV